jgi:O-antigen/teichoic acid export membrane protein
MVFLTATIGTGAFVWPRWDRACFDRMAREASLATCVRFVSATINNLDQVVIGPLVGSTPFAYFNLGKRIEGTFITAAGSFGSILFQPLFARRQAGQPPQSLDRAIAVLTVVCGLPAAVFVVNASVTITHVFGEKWAPATLVVVLLTASGLIRSISTVPGSLLSVSGRNRDLLIVATGSAIAGIGLVAALARFGIAWCAGALAVKSLVTGAWLAGITRDHAPAPCRTYTLYSILPFGLMAGTALAGRCISEHFISGNDVVATVVTLVVSGISAAVACLGYFCWLYPDLLNAARRGADMPDT